MRFDVLLRRFAILVLLGVAACATDIGDDDDVHDEPIGEVSSALSSSDPVSSAVTQA